MWKLGLPYLVKATAAARTELPIPVSVCSMSVCPNNGRLSVFGVVNVHTDVNACDCTWRLCKHCKRVFAESWLWEKNPLPRWGVKLASVLCPAFWSDALPTAPRREAGDGWCHPPVWNHRAVIWFPFLISLLVFFLPRSLALSVLSFFC